MQDIKPYLGWEIIFHASGCMLHVPTPAYIEKLQEQLTQTQQALDRAVEALEFYAAGQKHLTVSNNAQILECELNNDGIIRGFYPAINIKEFGSRAKAALASIKEGK